MTRRDSPLHATGIFLLQEKDNDTEWLSEKWKRGETEEVKEEEGMRKRMEEDCMIEIHCTREKKKGGNKERIDRTNR